MEIPRPGRARRGIFTAAFCLWVFAFLIQLGVIGGIVYAAVHFIRKYW